MDELHENRADFVQEVQNTVSEDLLKNGLELESVSLTALDQTPFESLDENNAFNAVGMRQLAEVIADSKKKRAEIDAEADTAVRQSAMEAAKRKLEIDREEEQAKLAQIQEVETLRAAQEAEIARRREDSMREAEAARISREREVRSAEIAREETIRAAEIAKERQVEVADQERQIVIATKSEEESRARASADAARAEAVKAEEAIATARQLAEADRVKRITIIDAEREAEKSATQIRLAAQAEKEAAADRAAALLEEATADADAIKIRAEAKKADKLAEAEGARALIDADNALSSEIVEMKVQLARLAALPEIVEQMVKPAEKIDSIKIHQVSGLGGGANGAAPTGSGDSASPVAQAINSIGAMAVQLPALRKIGDELGISLDDGITGVIGEPKKADDPKALNGSEPPAVAKTEEPKATPPAE